MSLQLKRLKLCSRNWAEVHSPQFGEQSLRRFAERPAASDQRTENHRFFAGCRQRQRRKGLKRLWRCMPQSFSRWLRGALPRSQRPGGQRPGGQRPGGQRPSGQRPRRGAAALQRPSGQRPSGQRPRRGAAALQWRCTRAWSTRARIAGRGDRQSAPADSVRAAFQGVRAAVFLTVF